MSAVTIDPAVLMHSSSPYKTLTMLDPSRALRVKSDAINARDENKWDTITTRRLLDPHTTTTTTSANKRTAGASSRFRKKESRLDETGKYVTSVGDWETYNEELVREPNRSGGKHKSRLWSDAGRSHGRWKFSAVGQPKGLQRNYIHIWSIYT